LGSNLLDYKKNPHQSRPSRGRLSLWKGISRDCPEDQLIVAQVKASVTTETGKKVIRSATHARGVKNQNLRDSSHTKPGQIWNR